MIFIGFIEAETDRAIFFQDWWWEASDWMPKSQVEILRSTDTHEVKLIASPWICGKKNIREFEVRKEADIEPPPNDQKAVF